MTKICQNCGQILTPKMFPDIWQFRRAKYCDKNCYQQAHAVRYELVTCEHCGKEFFRNARVKNKKRFCSMNCRYAHSRRNGGRYIMPNGYVAVKKHGHPKADSNGYVYEHRLVAEQMLGRLLESDEHVHHKNGNKTDNRPENLAIIKGNAVHVQLHHKEYKKMGIVHPINRPEAIKKRVLTRQINKIATKNKEDKNSAT